ncbi:hypothetical protein QT972_00200 [Microcoleus sp. herbarium7]|uniref:hypothetical protein n=1 Tax=Microcoleus sp. herbarium7 TaxID=3055435 RepID=UPI002FCED390
MPLPFVNRLADSTAELVLIEDGFGNSIEIPKKGCLTVGEQDAIEKYYMGIESSVNRMQANLAELTIFLKSRFSTPSLTPEQVSEQAGTVPMVERLAEFVEGEKTRWIPKQCVLDMTGELAREIAIDTAQKINGIAATRPDLLLEKRYLVFRTKGPWLDKFEIIKDFEGTTEGKSLADNNHLIGEKFTGSSG